MRKPTRHTWIVFLILLSGLMIVRFISGRPAPVPDVFAETLPLEQAKQSGEKLNKPVLVLATADWCPPCQHLKRGALRDERVASAIREKTVPVYLDVTRTNDHEVIRIADDLNISGLPVMILLGAQGEIARVEGDRSAIELLGWLEARTRGRN